MNKIVAVTGLHAGENPQPGIGVIRALRRACPELTFIGMVYDVLESGVYADNAADWVYEIPYPSSGSEPLLKRLDYILERHAIDILIPTLDAEILPLIKMSEHLERRSVKMMLPRMDAFQVRTKAKLAELAEQCDCRTPETLTVVDQKELIEAAAQLSYPMMIKGQYYEAYKVHYQNELIERFHAIAEKWGVPVVLQQLIHGDEFNVIALGDGEGDCYGYCAVRKTIRTDKGKGYGGIVIRDEQLNELAMRLIRKLDWFGPVELEFIKDVFSGAFHILEINPRFPAWVDFPAMIGQNLPKLLVDYLTTGDCERLPPYETGKFFLRHCVDLACDIQDMGQLSTLGELKCKGAES